MCRFFVSADVQPADHADFKATWSRDEIVERLSKICPQNFIKHSSQAVGESAKTERALKPFEAV